MKLLALVMAALGSLAVAILAWVWLSWHYDDESLVDYVTGNGRGS